MFAGYVMTLPMDSWFRSGPVANWLWNTDSVLLWAVCPASLCAVLPTSVRIFYLASLAAFIFIITLMILQRLFLRVLLSYQNWMVRAVVACSSLSRLLIVFLSRSRSRLSVRTPPQLDNEGLGWCFEGAVLRRPPAPAVQVR